MVLFVVVKMVGCLHHDLKLTMTMMMMVVVVVVNVTQHQQFLMVTDQVMWMVVYIMENSGAVV